MYTVVDIAAYILDKYGPMTTMKLQKLTYYSQAHHLVACGECFFPEDFQAWVNGPVAPELYREHKGMFLIHPGDLSDAVKDHLPLPHEARLGIDLVCSELSALTGKQLSAMTHREAPWRNAREGYGPSEHCENVISKSSMKSYYSLHQPWLEV